MPKHPALWMALLTLVAVAAGCGGGGPSKKEYIADFDKVCEGTIEQVRKLKAPKTVKGFASFAQEARPILKDSIRKAEDLELPNEDGDKFEAYIEDSKSSIKELDDLEEAADTGNGTAVRRVLVKTAEGSTKRLAQAKKLGLKKCGIG